MITLFYDGIDKKKLYFNLFMFFDNKYIYVIRKYDLKGSTVDREASEKELEKELPTLKDNDFIKQGVRVDIGEAAKEKLLETLTADVEVRFLYYT